MPEIYICQHCHDYLKGKARYCQNCGTAEKRKIMDEENKKFFEEKGSKYECHECDNKRKSYLYG